MRALFFASLMVSAGVVFAETESLAVAQTEIERADQAGRNAQQRIDRLDDQAQALLNEYRQIKAETDQLSLYNRQMTAIVEDQESELASLARQILEIERTERGILPLMSRMLDTLDEFVALDVPFLPQERSARVALLRDMMVRGDVAIAEKFRRVLEAYQIEIDYGRNIESYRGQVDNISYDFLRIGRVALYRLSNDGSQAWLWSVENQQWQLLDSGYLRDLRKALKVAQQVAAPELLVLPMPTQGVAQ
ncbi:MAG: DUF3450 domain-containing protein [Bacterioplanes sp.]|nr:DUF3450 domain-containing protein [Bacterioplanes sp.]